MTALRFAVFLVIVFLGAMVRRVVSGPEKVLGRGKAPGTSPQALFESVTYERGVYNPVSS